MASILLSAANAEAATMNFGEAVLMSLVGFVLVMAILCLLMGIIYLMGYIFKKATGKDLSFKALWAKITKKQPEAPAVVAEAPAAEAPVAPGAAGEFKLNGVPPEIAAMAMAIVADEMKTPLNELRFISIKEIKE